MIPLVLTIICSTSIALILKYNDIKGGNALLLLNANYFFAALASFLIIQREEQVGFSLETTIFGAALALLFVFSFFAFAKAVGFAGTALATASSRLSLIVSLFLSIFL
jgi:hypothetical protein